MYGYPTQYRALWSVVLMFLRAMMVAQRRDSTRCCPTHQIAEDRAAATDCASSLLEAASLVE
jgi:hypothetical protein